MHDDRAKEFVSLLTRYSRRIYSFIRSLVPNQSDAEDLFQDASTTLWEQFEKYSPGSDFRAWAFQIAYYKVLNYRQRKARLPQLFGDDMIEMLAAERLLLDDSLEARFRALADCYGKLTEEEREMVDLRYTEKATVSDVAGQMSRSVDYVYKALRRIHGSLYQCIDRTLSEEERP